MPKDTFLNLPEKKRRFIEDAAIAEFAEHGFDNASINRIVAECKIAKGSFYQYFADKRDLYKHLMAKISEWKLAYMTPVLREPEAHDLFTLLAALYRSGLAFARDNPAAARVGNQVYKNRSHSVYREIFGDGIEFARAFYGQLLDKAIANGEVRPDIDRRFITHILLSLSISIFDYYFEEVKGGAFDVSVMGDDFLETVDLTLDLIKHGIALETKELVI